MVALILRVSIVVLAICLPVMSHRQFQNLEKEPMVYHPERYSMTFAVEVLGGGEVAERVAKKYHFKHNGAVGNLKNMYVFGFQGSESEVDEMVQKLRDDVNVRYVERQIQVHHVKKPLAKH